jgi:hypothetical protein
MTDQRMPQRTPECDRMEHWDCEGCKHCGCHCGCHDAQPEWPGHCGCECHA